MRLARWVGTVLLLAVSTILPVARAEPPPPLPSLLLIASDRIDDPRFQKSVVLVTRHGGRGTIGIILNRPLDVTLTKLFPSLPPAAAGNRKVFFGGPVATGRLVFAFGERQHADKATLEVHPGIFLGHATDLLGRLLRHTPPLAQLRVFAGHAGWAPGQLEHEIARGDWYLLPVDEKPVFTDAPERLWSELHRKATAQRAAQKVNSQAL